MVKRFTLQGSFPWTIILQLTGQTIIILVSLLLALLAHAFLAGISLSGQVEEARLRNQLQNARTMKKVPGLAGITELNAAGKPISQVNKHGYFQNFIAWSETDP